MRKIIFIAVILFFAGCDSDTGWDCIKTGGEIVEREIAVPNFTEILVWQHVKLFVKYGEEQKVVVQTGENLIRDIELTVEDGRLEISDKNGCNLVRDYGLTNVYVTSPNITEIRNSSGLTVESIGVLPYPRLSLLSEDHSVEDDYYADGDFVLELDAKHLSVTANGLASFYLSGSADYANFGLFAGNCRIFAADLVVEKLEFYHRSSADMIVNPQQSIKGKIVGIGNVISENRPPIVEVEELYRGRLIFK
ncbi:MAG TPA: head GIN domain-containing protein [Aequorivita sp.]|nr:head GIN domain-containing protein [Aequorivita sp.]